MTLELKNITTNNMIKESFNIKKQLGINKFVYPDYNNYEYIQILHYMHNPNMYLLIIEEMCLGIFMTKHIAMKFGYIRGITEYGSGNSFKKYKVNILRISNQWDISKWSEIKLHNFYVSSLCFIEQCTIETLYSNIKYEMWTYKYIDLEFLQALSWSPQIPIQISQTSHVSDIPLEPQL